MAYHKIFDMHFNKVYPLYVTKATRKGRTELEVQEIINWLTGYSKEDIERINNLNITFYEFFRQAPNLNVNKEQIRGVVCGVRVESIADPLMQNIRYLDKLIDELAKGKSMDKILRK